jgi:hypothetical protein
MKHPIPDVVLDGLNKFNGLATQFEQDARSAHLIGDEEGAETALRAAYGVRLATAQHAAQLLEVYKAPQLDFQRSLGRLWLTCARHAARLKRFDDAREHALAGLRLTVDPQTDKALRAMLINADLGHQPAEVL